MLALPNEFGLAMLKYSVAFQAFLFMKAFSNYLTNLDFSHSKSCNPHNLKKLEKIGENISKGEHFQRDQNTKMVISIYKGPVVIGFVNCFA